MARRKTKKHSPRSEDELQRASLAVQYEVATLGTTHEMLQESGTNLASGPRERVISNALLHTFLLAARNLLGFLYSHRPRPTDIVAEDFFDDLTTWPEQRDVPEPEMANGELVRLISKRLAHLTWDRADGAQAYWGAFTIAWNISLAMQSFLRLVDGAKISPELSQEVEVVRMMLQTHLDRMGGMPDKIAPASELIELDDAAYFDPSPESDDEE